MLSTEQSFEMLMGYPPQEGLPGSNRSNPALRRSELPMGLASFRDASLRRLRACEQSRPSSVLAFHLGTTAQPKG